jgi:signal transduction histidine kinase/ActR/RegA family two-component response regulator
MPSVQASVSSSPDAENSATIKALRTGDALKTGEPAQGPELTRLKSLFLTTLNHEIRTPLAGLIGMTDLLLETTLDEDQLDYASTARLCAEDLLRIMNATLQYAALEAGQLKVEISEFNVRDLAEAAVAQHASKARAKEVRIFSSLETGLPQTLLGDGQHINEILGYLLDNALKFTKRGMIELGASYKPSPSQSSTSQEARSLEAPAQEGRLRFTVRDTGIGIAPEQRTRIFESFRQGDEGFKREYGGVGLGLTLANGLTELMGGTLSLESEVSRGSTFTVEIPASLAEATAETAVVQTAAAPLPRLLAVDDNLVGTAVLRHALKNYPIDLHTADSGIEAVASAARQHYNLILMDLQMPGMSGLEATAAIRKLPGYENVPILALTADICDEVRLECLENGMQGFLSKPIQSAPLWSAIQRELKLERT